MLRRCCGDRPRAMLLALVCCCLARNIEPEDKTKKKTDQDDDFYAPNQNKNTKPNKRGRNAKKARKKTKHSGDQEIKIIEKGSGDFEVNDYKGPSTSQTNTEDDDGKDKTFQKGNEDIPQSLVNKNKEELPEISDVNPELFIKDNSPPKQLKEKCYYYTRGISSEDGDKEECKRQFDYTTLDMTSEDSDEDLFLRIQSLDRFTPDLDLPDSETEGKVDYVFPTFEEISRRVEESIERTFGRDPFQLTPEELTRISENTQVLTHTFDDNIYDDTEEVGKPPNDPWKVIQEKRHNGNSSCSVDGNTDEEFDYSILLKDDNEKKVESFGSIDSDLLFTKASQTTEYDFSVDEEIRDLQGATICDTCGFFHRGAGHIDGRHGRRLTYFVVNEKGDKHEEESGEMFCPQLAFSEYNWRRNICPSNHGHDGHIAVRKSQASDSTDCLDDGFIDTEVQRSPTPKPSRVIDLNLEADVGEKTDLIENNITEEKEAKPVTDDEVKEDDSDDDGFPLLHSVGRKSRERNRVFRSREDDSTRRSPASPVRLGLHMSMAKRGLQSGDSACTHRILKWHTRRSTMKAANKIRQLEKRCHRRNP